MASAFLGTTPPHNKPASLHDSARASPEPLDGFDKLIRDINIVLGPSSGINSADVDVEELKTLMGHYSSNEAEWERYAFSDYSRAYTRNLVDNCNGKSNLVSCKSPGSRIQSHGHALYGLRHASLDLERLENPFFFYLSADSLNVHTASSP